MFQLKFVPKQGQNVPDELQENNSGAMPACNLPIINIFMYYAKFTLMEITTHASL